MELRGMNDRIKKLRKQSEETTPHIFMERAMLMTDAYKNTRVRYQFRSCAHCQ